VRWPSWWRARRFRRDGLNDRSLELQLSRWSHPTGHTNRPFVEPALRRRDATRQQPDRECRACGERVQWTTIHGWVHAVEPEGHRPVPGDPWQF
jgi:hypothetical protein